MPLTDQSITMAAGQDLYTGSLAPAALLTFAMDDAATLGVPAAASIVNSGATASGPWAIPSVAGLSFSPSSGASIAAGETQFIVVTSTTAGSKSALLICAGANISGNPQSMTVTNPAVLALTFSADDTGRVGTAAAGLLQNTGNTSLPWSITPPSGIGVSPSSGTLAVGATRALVITPSAVGTHSLTVAATGATITGNPQVLVAGPALATAITLSFASTGVTGATVSVTATPNGPIPPGGGTATLAASNSGTLGSTTLTFTAGSSAAQTTTLTRSTDGASVVTMTNSMGLTNTGSGASYTSSSEVVSAPGGFRLTSSTSGVLPFTVGMAFQQGAIPSGSGIAVSGATAQATIKSTWPDSSAKIAIIAGTYTSAGSAVAVTPSAGTASSGTALTTSALGTAIGTVTISAAAFGSATFSGADWTSPHETWVSGHLMLSCIYRKQIGTDSHLVAWLEVRYWSTGAVEVVPWVENGYSMVAGPTQKTATYSFTLGGTTRFSASVDLLHHQRTILASGTTLSHWLGTDPGVVPIHDTEYLQATGLVPAYLAKTPSSSASVTALASSFTPLAKADFANGDSMGLGGAAIHIGLLPQWDAVYLTCPQASTYKAVLINAMSFGRYNIHYRDESDSNRWARLSNFTTTQFGREPEGGYTTTPATSGTQPPYWDFAHHPSVGLLAYLLTGRRYFLDELLAVASFNSLGVAAGARSNGTGLFRSDQNGNTRHAAWCLRSLAQAIAVTPDSDTTGLTELRTQMGNNAAYYNDRYNTAAWIANPTRFVADSDYNSTPDSFHFDATWQQDYLQAAIGYAMTMGMGLDSTATTKLSDFFHWHAPATVGRFGFTGATEFLYRDYTVNSIATAPTDSPDYVGGTGPWYADWGEVYDATFGGSLDQNSSSFGPFASPGSRTEGSIRGWFITDTKATAAIAAIAYCVRHGATGADAAYQRLTSSDTWAGITADLDDQPLWGITWHAMPRQLRGMAVNEWREITGTAVQALLPTNTAWNIGQATTLSSGAITAHTVQRTTGANIHNNRISYGGVAADTRKSRLYTPAAGGHGDYWQNEVTELDLLQDAPAWAMVHAGSNGDVVTAYEPAAGWGSIDQRRYATDLNGQSLPCSRHTYGQANFIERHGRLVTTGGSISPNGAGFQDIEAYDVTITGGANGWDAQGTYPGAQGGTSATTGTGGSAIIAATCVKDPRTEILYTFSASTLHKVTPSTTGPTGGTGSGGTYSTASLTWNNAYPWSNGAAAVDTTRGKILWTHGYGENPSTKPYLYDIATATLGSALTYTGTAASSLSAVPPSCGVVYAPRLDRYLLRDGNSGGGLYVIHPTTVDVTSLSTTGGGSLPAQTGSGNGGPGVFTNWQLIPALRGAVYLPGAALNAWFIRLW